MEENAKLFNIHRELLEYLLEHHPSTMPPGAPEGTPPSCNVQLTLKSGATFVGNVRRGPMPGMYTATVANRDQRGIITGMAELYIAGEDLALIVRPLEEGAPRVLTASPSDLPAGIRIK